MIYTQEDRNARMDEIVEIGKTHGSLTLSEIRDLFGDMELDPDTLYDMVERLDKENVHVDLQWLICRIFDARQRPTIRSCQFQSG